MTRAMLILAGCSGGRSSDDPPPAGDDPPSETGTPTETIDTGFTGPFVTTTDQGDGTYTTIVRATSTVEWVYLSFADGELEIADPASSTDWDLAFRREIILANSSLSGPGTVDVAALDGIAFEAIRWAPFAGYVVDQGDLNGDEVDETAFATWFDYDYATHHLNVADRRYVVRTPDGPVRFRMDDYYAAEDNNSGFPTFTWGWIPDPSPVTGEPWVVDVTGPDPVHLALREFTALAPPDPATSDDWDLALVGPTVVLDGGISGPGGRSAASVPTAFDAVIAPPPLADFAVDAADADADGIPEYAMAGAFVSDGAGGFAPSDRTWVIARPDGTFDKLRFESWADGHPTFRVGPLDP